MSTPPLDLVPGRRGQIRPDMGIFLLKLIQSIMGQ
jgi:hypothetical protein